MDLSLRNIMRNEDGTIKITDFYFASYNDKPGKRVREATQFWSPEMIMYIEYVDWYENLNSRQ